MRLANLSGFKETNLRGELGQLAPSIPFGIYSATVVFIIPERLAAIVAAPRRTVFVHVTPEAAVGSKTAPADAAVVRSFSAGHRGWLLPLPGWPGQLMQQLDQAVGRLLEAPAIATEVGLWSVSDVQVLDFEGIGLIVCGHGCVS